MFFDTLYVINLILENNMIYLLLLLLARYVFLERLPDKFQNRIFYISTFAVISITSIFIDVVSQVLAIVFTGVAISIGRTRKKIVGFFITFPVVGIINGLIVPLLILPAILYEMTDVSTLVYRVVFHIILYIGVLLFWIKAKDWREKFNNESRDRSLQRWEFALLGVVSVIITLFSFGIQGIPGENGSNNEVIDYIKVSMLFMNIISFTLTIIVIILIVQGNKRSFYHKQALVNQEIAEQRREKVERMSLQMVRTLANTIDAKDSYTNGHSTRVAKYSVMIGKKMGYEGEKLELLEYTALLHDIGKIGIPNEIINKPSRLTDEEYEIIKTHPGIGGKILEEITEIPDIAIGARYHHERFDGRGYPDRLSGKDIPEIARIIGVADAYDAMTSNRSYRDLLAQEIVRGEIEKGKGTQFDPEIADVMISIIDEDVSYDFHE